MSSTHPLQEPTTQELEEAYHVELLDSDGSKHTFGELVKGKKVAVIFIRHFWCGVCQAYVQQLGPTIPPASLPTDTSIIIVGLGQVAPMKAYIETTHSQYPLYTNPDLELYKLFGFVARLAASKPGEEKEYEKDLGSTSTRLWNALKSGPMRNIRHANSVGPFAQNGGELILDKGEPRSEVELMEDGSVLYFHRMQHTADHTELSDIAKHLGVEAVAQAPQPAVSCDAGVKV